MLCACVICGKEFWAEWGRSRTHCGHIACVRAYEERLQAEKEERRLREEKRVLMRSFHAAARRAKAEAARYKTCPICGKVFTGGVFRNGICSVACKFERIRRRGLALKEGGEAV